jgi:hypothetical protein
MVHLYCYYRRLITGRRWSDNSRQKEGQGIASERRVSSQVPNSALNLASVLPKHHTPRQIQSGVIHCQRTTYLIILPKHHIQLSAQIYAYKMRRSGCQFTQSVLLREFQRSDFAVQTRRNITPRGKSTHSNRLLGKGLQYYPAETSHSALNIFLSQKTRPPELHPELIARVYFRANRAGVSINLIW